MRGLGDGLCHRRRTQLRSGILEMEDHRSSGDAENRRGLWHLLAAGSPSKALPLSLGQRRLGKPSQAQLEFRVDVRMIVQRGKLQGIHHLNWTSLDNCVHIAGEGERCEAAEASAYRNSRATVDPEFGGLSEKALLRGRRKSQRPAIPLKCPLR